MARDLEGYIKRIHNELREQNRKDAKRFDKYLQEIDMGEEIGLNVNTRYNYCKSLRTLEPMKKNYGGMTREDLKKWAKVLEVKYSPRTVNQHKACVKRFFRWFHHGEDAERSDYPENVRWIKTSYSTSRKKRLPKRILTKDEVKKMVGVSDNQRDRALIFTLYEAGTRAGEHMGMKIKDVSFDEYGAVIIVDGKTGMRRVRIRDSIPDLRLWINMHPQRDRPDAALWVGLGHPNKGKYAISTAHLVYLVKKYARAALKDDEISPHTFRHTRATHLANDLTEAQMKEFFGWEKDSRTPAIYTHLSGRDVDTALLKAYGVDVEERKGEKENDILAPIKCPICKQENPTGSKFCNCGTVIDMKTTIEIGEIEKNLTYREKLINELKEEIYKEVISELKAGRE